MKKGLFLTFEGIEGCGKSTHCRKAAEFLRAQGRDVLAVREPGGTVISERVREIILDKSHTQMNAACELLLYNAARVQLVEEVIRPALAAGKIVLCDRFYDSTIAYQCFGGKVDRAMAAKVCRFAAGGIVPAKTFLLDSDVARGLARAAARTGQTDRMEAKNVAFHRRVRRGFLMLAKENPRRFTVVSEMPIDAGAEIVNKVLLRLIKKR